MKKFLPVVAVIALVAASCGGGGAGPVDTGEVKNNAAKEVDSGLNTIKNLAGDPVLNPNDQGFENPFQQNGVRGWMDFSNIAAVGMIGGGMALSPAASPGKSINTLRKALKLKPLQVIDDMDWYTLQNYCPDAVSVEAGACNQTNGCCTYLVTADGSCTLPDGSYIEGSAYFEMQGCSDGTWNMNMSAELSGVDYDGTRWTFSGGGYFNGIYDETSGNADFEAAWVSEYKDDYSYVEEAAWAVVSSTSNSVNIDMEYGSLDCPSDWGGTVENCYSAEYASVTGLTWENWDVTCGFTANGSVESAWWDGYEAGYAILDMNNLVYDRCNCSYSSLLNDYEPAYGTISVIDSNETFTLDFTDGICDDNCVSWSYENVSTGDSITDTACGTW